jgi:hypothetical protein
LPDGCGRTAEGDEAFIETSKEGVLGEVGGGEAIEIGEDLINGVPTVLSSGSALCRHATGLSGGDGTTRVYLSS